MRTLDQLLAADSAWPYVVESVAAAARPVEILPKSDRDGSATLLALQVTTPSTLGASNDLGQQILALPAGAGFCVNVKDAE